MSGPRTEEASDQYRDLDTLPGVDVLSLIAVAQRQAIEAVADAVPDLVGAAEAIARRMRGGGRLIYAGAGSSGLLAQVDALELPGTFGIDPRQIVVLLAGGREALFDIPSGAEDDGEAAAREVEALGSHERRLPCCYFGEWQHALCGFPPFAAPVSTGPSLSASPPIPERLCLSTPTIRSCWRRRRR